MPSRSKPPPEGVELVLEVFGLAFEIGILQQCHMCYVSRSRLVVIAERRNNARAANAAPASIQPCRRW